MRSQQQVSQTLGISIKTINKYIQKHGLSRSHREARHLRYHAHRPRIRIAGRLLARLNGLLLSDAHLRLEGNRNARLTFGFKHRRTALSVIRELAPIPFGRPRPYMVHGGAYSEKSVRVWYFASKNLPELNVHRKRWYPHGKKRVPQNLRLTPDTLYWWYVGDGSLNRLPDHNTINLYFSSRSAQERAQLLAALTRRGFEPRHYDRLGVITIPRRRVGKFLRIIGPCRNPEYAYKWDFTPTMSKKEANRRRAEWSTNSWRNPVIRASRIAKLRGTRK